MKQAKVLFSRNTERDEVYKTSDGHYFFNKSHAQEHGKSLSDKTVTTITRAEAEAAADDTAVADAENGKTAAPKLTKTQQAAADKAAADKAAADKPAADKAAADKAAAESK